MKKLFLFFAVAILMISACKNAAESGYTISGKIENAAGKDLVLSKLGRELKPVDTVKIAEDGTYKFTGQTSDPEFYALSFSGTQNYITLVVDSVSNITLNSDTADFNTKYEVSGSDDCMKLKALNDRFEETMSKIDSLGTEFQKAQISGTADSIRASIDSAFLQIVESQRSYNKKFIDDNPKSLTSLIALSQAVGPRTPLLTITDDRDYFEKVEKNLSEAFPKSDAVKSLTDYLAKLKATAITPKDNTKGIGIGDTAPDISLPSPEGKTISLSSLKGNYVLLDFWAAWCRPCRGESATLVKNYNKYKSKGFTIFQVSLDQTKEAWVKAIKDDNLGAWNHVSDLKYWSSAPAQVYGVRSIPANFLLDPEGKVIATNLRGPILGQKLTEIYGF